jgi:hypothetical protein
MLTIAMYINAFGFTRYAVIDENTQYILEDGYWTPEEAAYEYGLLK